MTAHSNPILGSIIAIFEKCEGSKLAEPVLKELEKPISFLSDFLKSDSTEALFFALVFALQNQENHMVSLHDISEYLDYPFLRLLEYRYAIDSLEDKSLIYKTDRVNGVNRSENNGYMVTGSVSNSIIEGKPLIEAKIDKKDLETAINDVLSIGAGFREDSMDATEYQRQIISFERKVQYIDLFKNITEKYPEQIASRIMLYFFSYAVIGGEDFMPPTGRGSRSQSAVFSLLPDSDRVKRRKQFLKGKDPLIESKLVEKYYHEDEGRMGGTFADFRITDKGIKELFGSDAESYSLKKNEENELDKTIASIREMGRIYEEQAFLPDKHDSLAQLEDELKEDLYFQKLSTLISDDLNRWMYIDCVSDFLCGYESNLEKTLKDLYGHGAQFFTELRSFLNEKHFLIDAGFLEIEQNETVEKTSVTLTDKSVELLYGENADLYKRKTSSTNILNPDSFKEKTLFYSDDVQKQIDMLEESLKQEKLEAIQKRLESKGLAKGVAIILYGAPGTGKTETVYQLARKTNRKVLHVDISEAKSMWFGESEKRIKKIFTDYRSLCKSCRNHGENTPVLLFNEADALISKRNNLQNAHSVDQTENTIQNILLEEMEKLDGIMIATTNLCENMDKAFERRFLFKIRYEKPTIEARSKIWMNKLENLSEEDACRLAKEFDFSGGEIDNIVRKSEMDEIITGEKPDYDRLFELCGKERLEKDGERKMGFAC